jgi:transcriptional regulator with XRE-family HTH domain|nr:MAG TPA: repressor protein [Caudoviricetes sp.]
MSVFERIQKAAKKRGYNLTQVAEKAGFKSRNAIYRYNQGVTPPDSSLRSIAEVLDVSFEYLKGVTDDDTPKSITKEPDIEKAIDSSRMYQGRPIDESQKEVMKKLLKAYLDSQEK